MAINDKPSIPEWASGGTADVVQPDQLIKEAGYNATAAPLREWDNWLALTTYRAIEYLLESGITGYNDGIPFYLHGLAVGRDGKIYQSQVETNEANDPETDDGTYWKAPLLPPGTEPENAYTIAQIQALYYTQGVSDSRFLRVANALSDVNASTARTNLSVYSKAETDAKYPTKANNLSDLSNVATARTNLSVYSKTEADARYLNEDSNLSDLTNAATARTNLGVYSQTEVDNKTNTAAVLSATAAATVGAVGTYAFLRFATAAPADVEPGDTYSGAILRYSNSGAILGGTPSGTWMCMGLIPSGNTTATLWLRIS